MRIRHVIIGNPQNRRIELFQAALRRFELPVAEVVSYADLLTRRRNLRDVLAACANSPLLLRLESPGEDEFVERHIIAWGCCEVLEHSSASRISVHGALRLRSDPGRILYPRQWFVGYQRFLRELDATAAEFPAARWYSVPNEIACMFNKPLCHDHLHRKRIPVAPSLSSVDSFDDLREKMAGKGWTRVFVKLASSSSASGIVALFLRGSSMRAVTTMEIVGAGARTRFYNNLRIRSYERPVDIRRLINFVCRETAHVEQWLPKASQGNRQFDLRVVAIMGKVSHVVVRTSRGPITNLHLGNRRGDVTALRNQLGPNRWNKMIDVVEQAASTFPKSKCIGFDVLLKPGNWEPVVLEANAFGDLLPNVKCNDLTTHEAQVATELRS